MRIVIVDNYDSFTFNLYQAVAELSRASNDQTIVIRNDELDWAGFEALQADCVILSPGPGRPDRRADFGLSGDILRHASLRHDSLPILGVCLGHQGICLAFGGRLVHAPEPMHGRLDEIRHTGSGLFAGLPNPLSVVRYHSLLGLEPLPPNLRATSHTADGLLMALEHRTKPIWGVQFHPESICTEQGAQLLQNFLHMARPFARTTAPRSMPVASPAPPPAVVNRELFVRRLPAGHDAAQTYETLFADQELAVWLDSSRADATTARFSFMAGGSRKDCKRIRYNASSRRLTIEHNGREESRTTDLFAYLLAELRQSTVDASALPFAFAGGWVGYAGYELKATCGASNAHAATTPDSVFLFVERFVAFDHATGELYLVHLGATDDEASAVEWFATQTAKLANPKPLRRQTATGTTVFTASQSCATYLANIAASLEYLRDGESYEICLTNQLRGKTALHPLAYYQRLRETNPAPYAAFFQFPEVSIACSSPERFLKVSATGHVETKPIKGTIRRGQTEQEDALLSEFLATDLKSRAENLMIVDLLRNDLGRVCQVGSVKVPGLMQIESFPTVHQLVSTITGQLRPEQTAVDCLRAAFPGGSMTGAPKRRTMEIIDLLEPEARGVYSGCLGYLSCDGAADFNIVIRTAVFQGSAVSIGVGGAITSLSNPMEEWEETLLKAKALLQAFGSYTLITEDAAAQNGAIPGEPFVEPARDVEPVER